MGGELGGKNLGDAAITGKDWTLVLVERPESSEPVVWIDVTEKDVALLLADVQKPTSAKVWGPKSRRTLNQDVCLSAGVSIPVGYSFCEGDLRQGAEYRRPVKFTLRQWTTHCCQKTPLENGVTIYFALKKGPEEFVKKLEASGQLGKVPKAAHLAMKMWVKLSNFVLKPDLPDFV